ncbi:hypothetical protein CC78DRAFT_536141 [Lojkania enalia]|uniref:Uncharacterized protein n=1 Tax=Lojkania enalia TaxID=147567 RepID=A0A9P4K4N7_9PLEO|nr:hypothetical protein CC78DRAFT_536141 [Didymosphaeria enalia]
MRLTAIINLLCAACAVVAAPLQDRAEAEASLVEANSLSSIKPFSGGIAGDYTYTSNFFGPGFPSMYATNECTFMTKEKVEWMRVFKGYNCVFSINRDCSRVLSPGVFGPTAPGMYLVPRDCEDCHLHWYKCWVAPKAAGTPDNESQVLDAEDSDIVLSAIAPGGAESKSIIPRDDPVCGTLTTANGKEQNFHSPGVCVNVGDSPIKQFTIYKGWKCLFWSDASEKDKWCQTAPGAVAYPNPPNTYTPVVAGRAVSYKCVEYTGVSTTDKNDGSIIAAIDTVV